MEYVFRDYRFVQDIGLLPHVIQIFDDEILIEEIQIEELDVSNRLDKSLFEPQWLDDVWLDDLIAASEKLCSRFDNIMKKD